MTKNWLCTSSFRHKLLNLESGQEPAARRLLGVRMAADSALTLTVRLSLTLLVWPCPWCSKNHHDLATANPVNVMFHHVSFVKSLSHSQLSPAKALLSSINTLPLVSYERSAEFLLQRFRRLISASCSWRYAHWWASGDSGVELFFLLKITRSLLHPLEFPWSTHKTRILKSKS